MARACRPIAHEIDHDDPVSAAVRAWMDGSVERRAAVGQALGVPAVGALLGFGYWGAVYETGDRNVVVKVTADPCEADSWAVIERERTRHPDKLLGIAVSSAVVRLGARVKHRGEQFKLSAILREAVRPFWDADADRGEGDVTQATASIVGLSTGTEIAVRVDQYGTMMRVWLQSSREPGDAWKLTQARLILDALEKLPGAARLAQSLDYMHDMGAPIQDLHRANVGWAMESENLLLIDPGGYPGGTDLPRNRIPVRKVNR